MDIHGHTPYRCFEAGSGVLQPRPGLCCERGWRIWPSGGWTNGSGPAFPDGRSPSPGRLSALGRTDRGRRDADRYWPADRRSSRSAGASRSGLRSALGVNVAEWYWDWVRVEHNARRRGWRQTGPNEYMGPCPLNLNERSGNSACFVRKGDHGSRPGTTVIGCTPCEAAGRVRKLGELPGEPDGHFAALEGSGVASGADD